MSALGSYVSFLSGYIPAKVKDAAGLCPQLSEEVRHITWLSVERVFWPPNETVRHLLVVGYTDGFQLWDMQDPARELVSKQDKAISQAKLLPVALGPIGADAEASVPLGLSAAPLMAYLHRASPSLIRLFSLKAHDDVHLLRLTEPAKSLQASRRFFAVGFTRQVELYDALSFKPLFSVQCNGTGGPTFALGHRWLAYNLPPQQPLQGAGLSAGNLLGVPRPFPAIVKDGLQYLGQVGQRTLDQMLMPPPEGSEQASRGGVVAVRDAASRSVIAQFEDHSEPVEAMAWDPSGLQLVTCAALGHRILVHRALVGAEHSLMMHDSAQGGLALGSVVFQHLYTLSRGYTPAVISDIAISDDGQLVAVSSAKGTSHVFRLPPLHSAALGHVTETGAVRLTLTQPSASSPSAELGIGLSLGGGTAPPRPVNLGVCTRIRLGSRLLQEGLLPQCCFLSSSSQTAPSTTGRSSPRPWDAPRLCVVTRAGTLALYTLSPTALPTAGVQPDPAEWQALLTKEVRICRPLRHFTERRIRDTAPLPGPSRGRSGSLGDASQALPGPEAGAQRITLGPWAMGSSPSQSTASPLLGPRKSPGIGPRSPPLGPRSGPGDPLEAEESPPLPHEPSKWLSALEVSTHVKQEVPIWLSPQLTFHAYPRGMARDEISLKLREGQVIPGSQRLQISRPDKPGEGVRYEGGTSTPDSEERLSRLFGGAMGSRVDGMPLAVQPPPPRPATVSVGPAWGVIGEPEQDQVSELRLLEAAGMEPELDEDWLKA